MSGPGGIAEWYPTTIADVFLNAIYLDWWTGTSSDAGVRYLQQVRYANDTRRVDLKYETRVDPIADRRGGVRRNLTQRLKEIQVFVGPLLHHRIVMTYAQSGASNQSLLKSIQRFGNGCTQLDSSPTISDTCKALPPMEFSYSDNSQISASSRWVGTGFPTGEPTYNTPNWYAPLDVRFNPSWAYTRDISSQFADINGDGLMDIVSDRVSRSDNGGTLFDVHPSNATLSSNNSPLVCINNGQGWDEPDWSGAPNESAVWSDRLRALRFEIPSIKVNTVRSHDMPRSSVGSLEPTNDSFGGTIVLGTCAYGSELPSVQYKTASVQFSGTTAGSGSITFDATAGHNTPPGIELGGNIEEIFYPPPWDSPTTVKFSEIRPWPHFQFVDINADGRADMVMSAHLSGFNLSLESCTNPQLRAPGNEIWIPGADVTVVFINTGQGWEKDDSRFPSDGLIAES